MQDRMITFRCSDQLIRRFDAMLNEGKHGQYKSRGEAFRALVKSFVERGSVVLCEKRSTRAV
jgi:metal-responsive CopG/Arc/MetJ family transcriptional regulator